MTSKRIRIVTDSVADIPAEWLERWQIAMIPCSVTFGGATYTDDGVELDRRDFWRALRDEQARVTTAAPPVGLAEDILADALVGYDHLVCIHVPEVFSATIKNIRLAAHNVAPERITILDSHTLTFGIGMQALVAAEAAAEADDLPPVLEAIARVERAQKVYGAIATLEYIKRSGRLNALVANVGTLLNIKPIVSVGDDDVASVRRVRTFKRAINELEDLVRAEAPFDRLVVLHTTNEDGARDFLARIADIAPAQTPIIEVGPTLGTHLGTDAVGAATLPQDWRTR